MIAPIGGPAMVETDAEFKYRTVFVSDLHLGMRNAQAEAFLDFLRRVDADTYYLVGDIVDFWKVKRGPYWPQSHNDCLQKILRKARKGARVIFIPGNHDDGLREYCGMNFGGVEIRRDAIHETAAGRRYVVLHGDEFDVVVRYARWLAFLGDKGYDLALAMNLPLNMLRRAFGLGHWSLAGFLKRKVKGAVNFIGEFEDAVAHEAQKRNAHGMICGHIHHANDRQIGSVHYLNCGDWVESCTAIGEKADGTFEIIHWNEHMAVKPIRAPRRRPLVEAA